MAITNQPITIRDVSIVPGVSDHDFLLITVDVKSVRHKQTPRKIPLYKRANWGSLADQLSKDIDTVTTNRKNLTANELWEELKALINKGTDRHLPHTLSKPKDNLPWITPKIKKMIKNGIGCRSNARALLGPWELLI